jgi:hypothetical protein
MGASVSSDEKKPKPEGHFIARAHISWLVTFYFFWLLVQGILAALTIINTITDTPLLLPIFLIVTIVVGIFIFVFNILYWAPNGKTRKADLSKCGKDPSQLLKFDRLLRAANDQWLVVVVLGCCIFIGVFMIVFYAREGVNTFAPLSIAPSGLEITNFVIMKLLEAAILFVSGAAFIIAMFTGSDVLKRMVVNFGIMENSADASTNPQTIIGTEKFMMGDFF